MNALLLAHATTWWQANADAMNDAAQALADLDDTAAEET